MIEDLLASDPGSIHPVTRKIICAAEGLSAADAFRRMYRLKNLIRKAEPQLQSVDMLCVPTIPTFYTVADLADDPVTPNSNFGTYTNFVNLMDMYGIAVPTAARADGRPGSVTLLGAAGRDAALAADLQAVGNARLGATDWTYTVPPGVRARPRASMMRLGVCGVHMAGLPLNGDLTSRGARFVRKAQTTADYQFFALAGGPPIRPGLVRTGSGEGNHIGFEIWEMPVENFGSFMKTIPSPLGIGTIFPTEGDPVQGFLCETAGLSGVGEITAIGDWRQSQEKHQSARRDPAS